MQLCWDAWAYRPGHLVYNFLGGRETRDIITGARRVQARYVHDYVYNNKLLRAWTWWRYAEEAAAASTTASTAALAIRSEPRIIDKRQ
jgi:hypothetical protein